MLGRVSKKYESGKAGPGTISSGKDDPGGKSYGVYQLSSSKGTLQKFLNDSGYNEHIKGELGTADFDKNWQDRAKADPGFEKAQHDFIKKTHFDPLAKSFDDAGLTRTPAIDEALFSMSVQHGKAAKIVREACASLDKNASEKQVIDALYDSRKVYVSSLSLNEAQKNGILNRYENERSDVLKLVSDQKEKQPVYAPSREAFFQPRPKSDKSKEGEVVNASSVKSSSVAASHAVVINPVPTVRSAQAPLPPQAPVSAPTIQPGIVTNSAGSPDGFEVKVSIPIPCTIS